MTIKPLDPKDFNEQQQRVYIAIMALREANVDRIQKIEQFGFQMDLSTARVEQLISSLVHFGVLTIDQVLEIHKDWELTLRAQTKALQARIERQRAEAEAERRRPKLIVPGH